MDAVRIKQKKRRSAKEEEKKMNNLRFQAENVL